MRKIHTLIIGSGAAGLCCAVRLKELGVNDVLIAAEGLDKGTSINTGSDKQTYYKVSLCGNQQDSVYDLAKTLFDGGSMHGDIALIEAAYSARCFHHLVQLGVKFPTDKYGQFAGYKTDHDPRQRATSTGPYTSRDMCSALIKRVKELQVPVKEKLTCVKLLTDNPPSIANHCTRCIGAVFRSGHGGYETILAENTVFAVGGPGGLYEHSVYPVQHQTASIALALEIGAEAQNLPEMQFGLASVKHRWNVSGTYMQVIPRFVSANQDGSEEREFLTPDFYSGIFLKGYQWPFDVRKIDGSSLIDILVYIETIEKKRRVFLDYTQNPAGLDFAQLSDEAKTYLEKSGATFGTPIERLEKMNPAAVLHYAEHGIDLHREMLEIAVCAQHNNGGLAGTIWWESTNIKHLFPIGEVNGSHGIVRPGGAALNAGQVGAFRAAEYIANRYSGWTIDVEAAEKMLNTSISADCFAGENNAEFSRRMMSKYGGMIRCPEALDAFLSNPENRKKLSLTARYYLAAVKYSAEITGSRGSALELDRCGEPIKLIYPKHGKKWKKKPENESVRKQIMVLKFNQNPDLMPEIRWQPVRPIPDDELWFETAWKDFREGKIYD